MRAFNKKRKPKHSARVNRVFAWNGCCYTVYKSSKNESRIGYWSNQHVIKKRYRLGYEFIRMSKDGDDK